jgi:hypothetical protein
LFADAVPAIVPMALVPADMIDDSVRGSIGFVFFY